MRRALPWSGVVLAALIATGPAHAQVRTTDLLHDLDAASGGPAISTITTGRGRAAHDLAASYPADKRAGAEQMFGTLLDKFAQLEQSIGVPAGDLAGATALYVIASFEAYRDASVDPAAYQPVIRQLRTALGASPRLAAATAAERRTLYEQLAILGMLTAVTRANLASSPDPAAARSLRDSAKGYLAQLGVDPDALVIDARGLSTGPRAAAREPAKPAAAKPEAFAYRAAPGAGLAASAIEAIVYSWRQRYTIGGLQMDEDTYLLLKNGTVRRDVPKVPPEDFDAAAEQRAEPKLWGKWKKAGGAYALKFGDDRTFEQPPGEIVRVPGGADEQLDGTFEGASSYAIPGGAASWSTWSITFSRDRRFSRSNSGGVGGSQGFGDAQVVAGNVWDDEGSASSVSAANFGGGSTRRTGKTRADREGTYRIHGYTLELKYDNGTVERRFFFTNEKRTSIWFNGGEMSRKKR